MENSGWRITASYPERDYTVHEEGADLHLIVTDIRYTVLLCRRTLEGICPGHRYRLQMETECRGLMQRTLAIWKDGRGEEYAKDYVPTDGRLLAPAGCDTLVLEVLLSGCEGAAVLHEPILEDQGACLPRPVRLCAISHEMLGGREIRTYAENVRYTERQLDAIGPQKPDLVVLTECVFQTRAAEGKGGVVPTTSLQSPEVKMLCEKARSYHMYIVCSIKEEDAQKLLHNTGLLINRDGVIAGLYRKTHLTITEQEVGIPFSNELPVFETDFGTIGIQICWDHFFPEASRILALKGAQILAIPTHGFLPCRAMTRAVDNGVYVVTAYTTGDGCAIYAPDGRELDVGTDKGYAIAAVDLSQPCYVPYLSCQSRGNPNDYYLRERRPDLYKENKL